MSARELWDELLAGGGWTQLSKWRVDKLEEGLYIDFKQAAWVGNDVRPDDRKNLAKESSGFGNLEGGLIVYGADTVGKPEVLNSLPGVSPLDQYAERLRELVKTCTIPPIPGVDVKSFEDPGQPNRGVVVVYVPFTEGGPYRAVCSKAPDVTDRYFMRQTSDTLVMPHQILAAMFGRTPRPRLQLGLERRDHRKLIVHVRNVGLGTAITPFVRLKAGHIREVSPRAPWIDRRYDLSASSGWIIGFALAPGDVIYPGESRHTGTADCPSEEMTVTFRLDCQNASPIESTETIKLVDQTIVWLGTAEP